MTFARRRTFAWTLLLAGAALGVAWLSRVDFGRKISTDVLDLIPVDERNVELALVRGLASEAEARTMLFVLSGPGGGRAPLAAGQRFAAELGRSGEFQQAIALGDPAWRDAMGKELLELRFALLFPMWLQENQSATLAQERARKLRAFLETPEALAFQDLIPADPLLLLPDAVQRMRSSLELLQPAGETDSAGLVWAQLVASPLSEAGQQPAFAAIARATAAARAEFAGLRVAYTGVNRFAAASRTRIEREVSWLNLASLGAVLAVAVLFIRGVHRALHLAPVIALALLGAWCATTLVFDRVHVVVLVLGALLAGVAIDYGFYLYLQPPARPDEEYPEKVTRLAKPLLASCLTTVTGFALLLASELPLIRQLGVFVGTGLLCALTAAVLYFATLRQPYLQAREFRGGATLPATWRRRLRLGLTGLALLALPGLLRIAWRDDVRELEVPAVDLRREDAAIRAAFGQRETRAVFLTHGATVMAARDALQKLERWLGPSATTANLAALVPTAAARAAAADWVRQHPDFVAEFRTALVAEGFTADAFAPFFAAYADYAASREDTFESAIARLAGALRGPPALLLHVGADRSWFVTLASGAPAAAPPADTSTVTASQLQSLNRLFESYRRGALHLSLAGLALVGAGVFLTYGRDGARIFAIPAGACLAVFGAFGWLGHPLNLFHLLGAFLGVCLTHNYSIFSATSAYRGETTPVSVRLSALTTAASFGVLACSGIPVVRALGLTVALIVVVALLFIELEHLRPLQRSADAR